MQSLDIWVSLIIRWRVDSFNMPYFSRDKLLSSSSFPAKISLCWYKGMFFWSNIIFLTLWTVSVGEINKVSGLLRVFTKIFILDLGLEIIFYSSKLVTMRWRTEFSWMLSEEIVELKSSSTSSLPLNMSYC